MVCKKGPSSLLCLVSIASVLALTFAISIPSAYGSGLTCVIEPAKIVASKIVCDNESDLPNWGAGPDITSSTAQNYVGSHPGCRLESGWNFQWAYGSTSNPGDNTGLAGAGWHTFGPTNSSGQATASISDLQGTAKIWGRQGWQGG